MKAQANQIGNSQKEEIVVDGEVFLKAVKIGRWNYVNVIKFADSKERKGFEYFTKHASREAAEKFSPDGATSKMYWPLKSDVAREEKYGRDGMAWAKEQIKRFKQRVAEGGVEGIERCRYTGRTSRVVRWNNEYTKTTLKVER